MPRVHKMQAVHITRPRVVNVTRSLEDIFERLARDFELTAKENKLGIDMIKDSESRGDGYSLHYQRFWMDKNLQDEGLVYNRELFGPLEIYAYTDFGKPSLNCEIPSARVMDYRLFLVDISSKVGDLAAKVAFGSFLPEPKVIGKKTERRVYQKLDLVDFSEVYDFLVSHIRH